jgi:hypothetical protein
MGIKTIIIVVVALAVASGGAFYVANKNDGQANQSGPSIGENSSIKDLLASGENIQCTYSFTDDDGNENTGTTYIADERLRGSFTLNNAENGIQTSNMLRDTDYQYVWNDGSNEGFKTKVEAIDSEENQPAENTNEQEAIDQDQKYDFDCSEWSVDETVFEVPANVEFTDYSSRIEQSRQLQEGMESNQQDACKQLSGQAREACEDAI